MSHELDWCLSSLELETSELLVIRLLCDIVSPEYGCLYFCVGACVLLIECCIRGIIKPARSPCAGAVISMGVLGVLWRGVVCCSMSGIAGLKDHPEWVVINGWLGRANQLTCEVRTTGTKCDVAATK